MDKRDGTRGWEEILGRHITVLDKSLATARQCGDHRSLPLVTVITPSYNQGRFLERTILSVLNQDWPNIEYVIVDGGSTDNSVEIIGKYEEYLAWWVSEKDTGQSNAINKGIGRGTGRYLTWLGSDDILLPGAITTMVRSLEGNPAAGMVYGAVAFIDEADRFLKKISYTDMTLEKLLHHKHSTIAQPSSLLRKATLDEVGGLDESLHYSMDYDLWIRLHRHAPSLNLGEGMLAGYRLHGDSKTVGDYTRMALEKIRVNRRYSGDLINKVIYAHYWYIIEGCVRRIRKGTRH
jgi:glycosyltransferase involved in cell wall biosynthesis